MEFSPQLLTQADANSRLPLHMASIATSPVPLTLLLTTKSHKSLAIDIDCVDSFQRTSLHYAAAANKLENVQVYTRSEHEVLNTFILGLCRYCCQQELVNLQWIVKTEHHWTMLGY